MSFSSRLASHPVVVEVIPPKAGASEPQIEKALNLVGEILEGAGPDAVNVPEIIGSAFQGMDAFEFGQRVGAEYGVDVVVNKVTVHSPRAELERWIDGVLASDIASVILVGGERGGIYYPGPGVRESNRIVRARAEAAGRGEFPVGNITIPSRPQEALRMCEKVKAGCDYFTSQIVYDFPSANVHLQAYEDVSGLFGSPPRPVLYAFSPVENQQDVLFLRYLGVHVPPEIERDLLGGGDVPPGPSLRIIESIWGRLLDAARARNVRVPLGLVAETVSRHNAQAVVRLVETLRAALATATLGPVAEPAASPT